MGVRSAAVMQEVVVKVAVKEFDATFLDEVERYAEWLDLAQELDHARTPWLVKLT